MEIVKVGQGKKRGMYKPRVRDKCETKIVPQNLEVVECMGG